MTIDPGRLAEATLTAAATLTLITVPVVARAPDGPLLAVLLLMTVALTSGFYALHAVTFDCLRLAGLRKRRHGSLTQSNE